MTQGKKVSFIKSCFTEENRAEQHLMGRPVDRVKIRSLLDETAIFGQGKETFTFSLLLQAFSSESAGFSEGISYFLALGQVMPVQRRA